MYIMKLNNKPDRKNKIYIKQRRDGDSAEKWFEKWLENGYIDRDWELTTTGWKVIDYVSAKEEGKNRVYIEMKGRNISIHNYRTTMIGESKIKKARKYLDQGADVYFFFLFRGKAGNERELYFYDARRCWKGLEKHCIIDMGGTNKRGVNEYKNHLYIPCSFLTKVEKYKDMEEYHKFNQNLGKSV